VQLAYHGIILSRQLYHVTSVVTNHMTLLSCQLQAPAASDGLSLPFIKNQTTQASPSPCPTGKQCCNLASARNISVQCEKVTALQACKQAAEQSHPASRMQSNVHAYVAASQRLSCSWHGKHKPVFITNMMLTACLSGASLATALHIWHAPSQT
jgi:hypothetical protein